MKPDSLALMAAAAAAVAIVYLANRNTSAVAAGQTSLADAQRNSQLYGGSVKNWMDYHYIDNDPVPGIEIPGTAF